MDKRERGVWLKMLVLYFVGVGRDVVVVVVVVTPAVI